MPGSCFIKYTRLCVTPLRNDICRCNRSKEIDARRWWHRVEEWLITVEGDGRGFKKMRWMKNEAMKGLEKC